MQPTLLRSPVDVETRGGWLTVDWRGGSVTMTGPAETVFEGEIELPVRASPPSLDTDHA